MPEAQRLDLPEIGHQVPIFLQIEVRDSLESRAVILCCINVMSGGFDAATGAAGERRARSVSFAARSGHQHGARAGEAGADDRLAVSGREIRRGLPGWPWPAAVADAADGGTCDPQAHLQPQRRGRMRTLDREPVLPVLLRGGVLPTPAAARSLLDDPLAQPHGRGAAAGAVAGEPGGGHQNWCDEAW